VSRELPSFDLVVATLGRAMELERLLLSLEAQSYSDFRVIVVDQNEDDRVLRVLEGHGGIELLRMTSDPGLSRARNAGLDRLAADVIAFPDDDCVYPPSLLEAVAQRFADDDLDGLSVRTADRRGHSDAGWGSEPTWLAKENVWNLAASAGVFMRRSLVERVGRFDERIGVGSPGPWDSGEETDYVIRALELGARIEYDPTIVVEHKLRGHDAATAGTQGFREGASVGYLLRKHGYPARALTRMAVRPAAGAAVSLARLDTVQARFYVATLRGRLRGYFGTSRAKSSA
jgi:GT2 family glycosyltransferase